LELQNSSEFLEFGVGARGDFPRDPKKFPRRRVLIVDDEFLIRWSLGERLRERGWETVAVGSGAQAISAVLAARAAFDVVLLDLRLPDSRDLALLARLRQMLPRARLILMTAYSNQDVARQAFDLGVFSIVAKPFEMDDVVALISSKPAPER
jgi:DNA-binding NtrC family response regulator